MKLYRLVFLFLSLFFFTVFPKIFVDSTIGDTTKYLLRRIANTLDEVRSSFGQVISEAQTIEESGLYILSNNIDGGLIVNTSHVWIDLNNYEISENSVTGTAVKIANNLNNVVIKNGLVSGGHSGIVVNSGSEFIHLENIKLIDSSYAIHLSGRSTGTVQASKIKNCHISDCDKGVVVNYGVKNVFQNCEAFNCSESGFELSDSWYNVFEKCKALETKNGELEKSAIGFKSTSGRGNLFVECCSLGTQKTASDFCTKAVGFLFDGTDIKSGETESKIINCIANSAQGAGEGNSYGIFLDMVLRDTSVFDVLDSPITVTENGVTINTTDWSPNSEYIAIGSVGSSGQLEVFNFDGTTLMAVRAESTSDQVNAVAWSPDGELLAVGSDVATVYKFAPDALNVAGRLLSIDSVSTTTTVLTVAWAPNGRHVAFGLDSAATNEIQVWMFDGSAFSSSVLATETAHSNVNSVAFSPDGNFLSVVYSTTLQVFSFDPLDNSNVLVLKDTITGTSSAELRSVDWSPIAVGSEYYLVVGGDRASSTSIEIFEYDGATTLSSIETADHGADVYQVKWSPNGKYVLAAGDSSGVDEISIFSFDLSAITKLSIVSTGSLSGGGARSCDWSPSGRYAVVVGESASGFDTELFEVAHVPTKCAILENEISNNTGGLGGMGLSGASGENIIIKNIGYENGINFSSGIVNQFRGGLNGSPTLLDNISVPPYED